MLHLDIPIPAQLQSALEQLPSLYILLPALFFAYQLVTCTYGFVTNLRDARASGIPYVITPWYHFDRRFLVTEPLWFPILSRLPSFITQPWLSLSRADWCWYYRCKPYVDVGSDTIMLCNYSQNMIFTCDADVINQIASRRNDFVKPIQIYEMLDLYGKNVVTVEGAEWRRHRKVMGAQFNEKSNELVWKESLYQAQEMVRCWRQGGIPDEKKEDESENESKKAKENGSSIIHELGRTTMKMSLGVISRAGFGVRCLWPSSDGQNEEDVPEGSMSSTTIPEGHVMSYVESLETLLHYIIAVLLLPDWLLQYSPFKLLRTVRTSFLEWGKYMRDIYLKQVVATKAGHCSSDDGLDLMGAMVRSSGVANSPSKSKPGSGLNESEILGNAFVLFLAGHETTANSIHFVTLFLAMRPDIQRKLQAELDELLAGAPKDASEWDYETYLPSLFAGWAGAIMNEQLRLLPPVVNIPKTTDPAGPPQHLRVNGKDCVVAPGTFINLNTACAHRNPKFWPAGLQRKEGPFHPSNTENDMEEFKPERWFVSSESPDNKKTANGGLMHDADQDTGVDLSPDTAATMFRPPKGAYIPFSEGFRACLGRRFAQVEILAAIAVIFRWHSIELCCGDECDEERVRDLDRDGREEVWQRARREVERKINEEASTVITLQLRGKPVKLRVCERGQELFDFSKA